MSHQQIISAIIGMILGDAHISKRDLTLSINHCEAQKEYLLFKKDILQKKQKQIIKPTMYYSSGYPSCRLWTRKRPIYRILRKWIYKDGKKTITRKILDKLDLLGIAIWFMDDGSTTFKWRNGKIHAVETVLHTYISKEQNEIIVKYFFEKWGIKWGLNKSKGLYRLRCGTREAKKFATLIDPFVIPSMKYKTNKLLNYDGDYRNNDKEKV